MATGQFYSLALHGQTWPDAVRLGPQDALQDATPGLSGAPDGGPGTELAEQTLQDSQGHPEGRCNHKPGRGRLSPASLGICDS